jgi:hypothetical protein
VLATAALAEPVLLLGIGGRLTAIALGLLALQLLLATAVVGISLRRGPGGRRPAPLPA